MCGPSTPSTTTQNVVQTQQLPQWYTDYLQNVMGRAVTQAGSQQPPPPTQQIAALTPDQQQAYAQIRALQGSATPSYTQAGNDFSAAQGIDFQGAVQPGISAMQASAARDTAGIASPYVQQGVGDLTAAGNGSALGQAQPYLSAATSPTGLAAASPYLGAASQSSAANIGQYMNPYNTAVTDRIAQLGARNLSEQLLPQINDQFVRSGQYGSPQQRDVIGRALRDENESVLGQQAQALQQGYGQALNASSSDLSRQAGLASTAGGLGTAQQQTLLGAGSQIGQLSSSDLARLQASGINIGNLGLGLSSANATDAARQLAAGQGIGQLGLGAAQAQATTLLNAGQAQRDLGTTAQDQAARQAALLEQVGAAQQGQGQSSLNAQYNAQQAQYNLPWDTIGKLSGVIQGLPVGGTTSGTTQTTTPGPNAATQIGGIGLGVAGLANSGLFKAKGGRVSAKTVKYKRSHSYGNTPKRGIAFDEAA